MDVSVAEDRERADGTAGAAPAVPGRRRRLVVRVLHWLGEAALVCVVVSLPVGLVFRPWSGRWRIPADYGGDGFVYAVSAAHANALGTVGKGNLLGAPNGFRMIDFPLGGDRLHLAAMRLIHVIVSDWLTVVNVYYLLSFYLVALLAYVVFRSLKLRVVPCLVASVLFAFLPYHFARGFPHVTLAAYVGVPVAGLIVIWLLTGRLDWTGSGIGDMVRNTLADRRWWLAFAMVLFVAVSSIYYMFFLITIVVLIIPVVVVLRQRWSSALAPFTVLVMCGVGTVLTLAPDIVAKLSDGANTETFQRFPGEADLYGLRLSQVLLPIPDHRVPAFAELGKAAYRIGEITEFGAPIGLVGVIGLFALVGFALVALFRRGRGSSGRPRMFDLRGAKADDARAMLLGTGLAFLASTTGGIGMVVAVLGFTQIRVWGRMTVVIGFFALGGLAILLDRMLDLAAARRWRVVGVQFAAIAVLAVGLLDQIGANPTPDYDRIEATRTSDRNFVGDMAKRLGPGASVLQLPYQSFPESTTTAAMPAYDQLRGFLNDQAGLKWSFGGTRGREADWQQALAQRPAADQVVAAAAAGFDALSLDRLGYATGDTTEREITALLGPPVGTSDDGQFVWFDLRPVRQRLDRQLGPARVGEFGKLVTRPLGLQVVEPSSRPDEFSHDLPGESTLEITRYDDDTSPARLDFLAKGPLGSTLVVTNAGQSRRYALKPDGVEVQLDVDLRDPVNRVHLSTDAPNSVNAADFRSDVSLRISDVSLTDARFVQSLRQLRDAAGVLCEGAGTVASGAACPPR